MEKVWRSKQGAIVLQRIFGYHSTRSRAEVHHSGMHIERDGDERTVADLALNRRYERRGIDNVKSDARQSQSVNWKAIVSWFAVSETGQRRLEFVSQMEQAILKFTFVDRSRSWILPARGQLSD